MFDLSLLTQVHIKLTIAGADVLAITLTREGTLNRLGDGETMPPPLFMGRTEEPLFAAFLGQLSPELLELTGRYTYPNPQGDRCELSIALSGAEIETGFAFSYGTDSEGPPEEIVELVEYALDLTDPWYEAQLARKRGR